MTVHNELQLFLFLLPAFIPPSLLLYPPSQEVPCLVGGYLLVHGKFSVAAPLEKKGPLSQQTLTGTVSLGLISPPHHSSDDELQCS